MKTADEESDADGRQTRGFAAMSSEEPCSKNLAGAESSDISPEERLEERLREAGLDIERFVDLTDGTKRSYSDHTESTNQYETSEVTGNYGVLAGDGLLVLDLDTYRLEDNTLPTAFGELPDTYTVASPHGGEHRYYAVNEEVSNSKENWGEVQAENQYVVGPGSVLDSCKNGWHDCSGEGEGQYTELHNRPIASVSTELIPTQREESDMDTTGSNWDEELPEVDPDLAEVGDAALKNLQHEHTPAFNSLVGLLRGDDGGNEELVWKSTNDGGREIDRSLQELMALTRLHQTVVYLGKEEGERAEAITRSTFEKYVQSHQYTDDGQKRKWLEKSESYRRDRLGRAFDRLNQGKFQRFLNQRPVENEWERWTGEYSDTTYAVTRFALDLLTGEAPGTDVDTIRHNAAPLYGLDLDRDLLAELLNNPHPSVRGITPPQEGIYRNSNRPTMGEVAVVARMLDKEENQETAYKEALRRMRRDGLVAMACMEEGVEYRYYPYRLPDPEGACYVKLNGEKHDPEPPEENESSGDKVHLRTDGGKIMSKNTDQTPSNEYSNEALRERFDHVVVSSSGKSTKSLHIPDGDEAEPLCGVIAVTKNWILKPVEVYPSPDYYEYCDRCREILCEQDCVGNALVDDW